jgi:GH15 family glucan-1,4-alpha-glucosidase
MVEQWSHVLREYAVLADGQRGIVVGPRGDFAWMCMPRWDSDAVFARLLGGQGGYSVEPDDVDFVWGGHYEPGSLIWRSRWVSKDGIVECREALAYPGQERTAVVLRRIICLEGRCRMRVALDARAGFGEQEIDELTKSDSVWTGRTGSLHFRWSGGRGATRRSGHVVDHVELAAGEQHDLVLELSQDPFADAPPDAQRTWKETEQAWHAAVPEFDTTVAPRDSRHAYAVLRGLTAPGGGMVAAVTTSLPERADAGRNYDYRYSWVRDQCFAGQAVAADGPHPILDDAVDFVSARLLADGSGMAPAYTVTGGPVPEQRSLALPGYPGGDVRVGNWVRQQFQLDAFGEALLLLGAAAEWDRLDLQHWRAVEAAVEAVRQRWGDPGAGVWEINDDRWTHSRLICAAGLRRVAKQAPAVQGSEWVSLADAIVAEVGATSVHPDGYWQRSPTDARVDAALLLPALRGGVPADDPRSKATVRAVGDSLADDYFLYRYRHDRRPLDEAEGAFLVSGFHMALALEQQGEHTEAMRWFERNRSACGPPGLFTEEFDIVQRQLRGNLPQAFVHALMFEAGRRLADGFPTTEGDD